MTEKQEKMYFDVDPQLLTAECQGLIAAQRETYLADKVAKQAIVARLNAELPATPGKTIVGTTYTRWGQLQFILADKTAEKAKSSKRPTLLDYIAQRTEGGLNA